MFPAFEGDLSEEQLVGLSARGNDEAFGVLFVLYAPRIRAKVSRCRVRLDEDDLFQEGAIGLLDAVRHYRPGSGSSFRAFASVCIERRIYTAVRASMRQKNLPRGQQFSLNSGAEEQMLGEAGGQTGADPAEALLSKEKYRSITKIVDQNLSGMEHKVFKLYLSGRSYQEIAIESGLSEKSVDNALQRIRRKLRRAVSSESK